MSCLGLENNSGERGIRLTLINILFIRFSPGFHPVGAIHGPYSSRWSAGETLQIPHLLSFSTFSFSFKNFSLLVN